MRQLGAGLFSWLPLGQRVLLKVQNLIRKEMDAAGAQEMFMPVVQPAELWQESGRWHTMGAELLRFQDRGDRDYCLSPTHEEVVTDIFRKNVHSYRQLPCTLYHISTKFRDEVRPRFGVLRAREFTMKDAYSFDLNDTSLDASYQAMFNAYSNVLKILKLDFRAVDADTGNIGGKDSQEFHVLADSGEDVIAYSDNSDYVANVEKAEARRPPPAPSPQQSLERVATPNIKTIDEVSGFLGVAATHCVKTLIVRGKGTLVGLVLRGDHELNELKAEKLPLVAAPLAYANPEDIASSLNCEIGSIGPMNLPIPLYVDRDARALSDFVAGANQDDFHFVGMNWERDVFASSSSQQLIEVADLRFVVEGDPAPDGSGPLKLMRGIEVGHIFKLQTKYTDSMSVELQTEDKETLVPTMGCYGFGVTRLVGAVVEQCHHERGISWPEAISPMDVHLVGIDNARNLDVADAAAQVLEMCEELRIDVLYDDRDVRAGVKFADADLIGIPHRMTIGKRGLKQGNTEYRHARGESIDVPVSEIRRHLQTVFS